MSANTIKWLFGSAEQSAPEAQSLKIVIVGSAKSGKTSLIAALHGLPSPILADSVVTRRIEISKFDVTVDNVTSEVSLIDTTSRTRGGRMDYGRDRRIVLRKADAVLITLNVADRRDMNNISKIWLPEVQNNRPDVPVIIVGTHVDIRDDPSSCAMLKQQGQSSPLTTQEGEDFASTLGAKYYHEISAVTKSGVNDLLELAVTEARAFQDSHKTK